MKISTKEEAIFKLGELEEQVKEIKTWLENNSNNDHIENKRYDKIWNFFEGFAAVQLNNKYGLINQLGQEICPPKYDSIWYFYDGFAKVELNGKIGYIDTTGKEYIDIPR
jgi:hypothetical protein